MFTPVSKSNISRVSSSSEKLSVSTIKSAERNKTLLTPCRRVGLKRRSIGNLAKKQLLEDSLVQNVCENTEDNVISSGNASFSPKCVTEQTIHLDECATDYCNNENINSDFSNSCKNRAKNKRLKTSYKDENILDLESNANTVNKITSRPENINLEVLDSLANSIKEKKESYKHIVLSQIYDKKHNIQTLMELTEKWKQGCQSALSELHQLIRENGHTLTMTQLLAQFQIPHDSIGYSEDCEDFE